MTPHGIVVSVDGDIEDLPWTGAWSELTTDPAAEHVPLELAPAPLALGPQPKDQAA